MKETKSTATASEIEIRLNRSRFAMMRSPDFFNLWEIVTHTQITRKGITEYEN